MPNLTKRDLVVRISNETGMVQQDVLNVIQRTLDHLTESLAHGQAVELRNFGVFEVKLRKARVGRNPNRPEHDVPDSPSRRGQVQGRQGNESESDEALPNDFRRRRRACGRQHQAGGLDFPSAS
jgi:nucleoid DNA-binding protein